MRGGELGVAPDRLAQELHGFPGIVASELPEPQGVGPDGLEVGGGHLLQGLAVGLDGGQRLAQPGAHPSGEIVQDLQDLLLPPGEPSASPSGSVEKAGEPVVVMGAEL